MSGKILYSYKQDILAGNKIQIQAACLSKGMYILTIKKENTSTQLKVIKDG
jgi:hypothetical protein